MAKKQKDAVFEAICVVLGTSQFSSAVELSKEQRQSVSASLLDGFRRGEIEIGGDYLADAQKLSNYTSGLISNWLRKDGRLNGGGKYTPKNPGSRTGSSDDQVKALKQLLDQTDDADAKAEIQKALDERLSALNLTKLPPINVAALPESVRHLVPSNMQAQA